MSKQTSSSVPVLAFTPLFIFPYSSGRHINGNISFLDIYFLHAPLWERDQLEILPPRNSVDQITQKREGDRSINRRVHPPQNWLGDRLTQQLINCGVTKQQFYWQADSNLQGADAHVPESI